MSWNKVLKSTFEIHFRKDREWQIIEAAYASREDAFKHLKTGMLKSGFTVVGTPEKGKIVKMDGMSENLLYDIVYYVILEEGENPPKMWE